VSQWTKVRQRFLRRARMLREQPPLPTPPLDSRIAPPERSRVPWPPADAELVQRQALEYASDNPKSIVELQPNRRTTLIAIKDGDGADGTATLINLNPAINVWYLLTLTWMGTDEALSYHLTNADPAHSDIVLDSAYAYGVVVRDSYDDRRCNLWSGTESRPLDEAAAANAPYVGLCDDRISLRLKTAGHKTSIEKATDFLRRHVPGGEAITVFVREKFFEDAFLDTATILSDTGSTVSQPDAPDAASLDSIEEGSFLEPDELGISVEGAVDGRLRVGQWYEAQGLPGIFVSIIRPDLVSPEILTSYPSIVGPLDEVERRALAYLLAFDLARFELGFALGTDHPRVNWSDRVPAAARDHSLPGPDGIDDIAPLISTGIIGPAIVDRVAATFTGGFKRTHGAFASGPLALVNHGSHYGFIENGVIFSKLQPGLATLLVLDDGSVDMTTWTEADDADLEHVEFARQNGVPLVEWDTAANASAPGAFVNRWGPGNWSGSQEGRVRALRSGACLQDGNDGRFLIYAYFSTATPAAMARVFQAYRCRYAMLLDMNALEHTYGAVYRAQGSALQVEHIIQGMSVLDKTVDGLALPRFLGYADNRDFFYLLWKTDSEVEP